MIDENGDPSVVEFNVRFGDPECQVTIPMIKADLVELFTAACEDKLNQLRLISILKVLFALCLPVRVIPLLLSKEDPLKG